MSVGSLWRGRRGCRRRFRYCCCYDVEGNAQTATVPETKTETKGELRTRHVTRHHISIDRSILEFPQTGVGRARRRFFVFVVPTRKQNNGGRSRSCCVMMKVAPWTPSSRPQSSVVKGVFFPSRNLFLAVKKEAIDQGVCFVSGDACACIYTSTVKARYVDLKYAPTISEMSAFRSTRHTMQ